MSATGVIDVIGIGQIIAAFLQFWKVVLERWLKPTDPLHDPAIQLSAGLLGVVGYVVHAATLGTLTGALFWDQAGTGFLSGLSAIVTYHILSTASSLVQSSATGLALGSALSGVTGQLAQPRPTDTVGLKPLTAAAIQPAIPVIPPAPINPLPPDFKPYEPPKPAEPVPVVPVAPVATS